MKFSVAKETIFPLLQYAGGFTAQKNVTTILQNVYIEAENQTVTIKTTNFQTSFNATLNANIVSPGCTTVSAKKLADVVKELPESEIDFIFDGSRLHIKSGKSTFQLATMEPDSFPKQPPVTAEYSFNINTDILMDLFKKTAFCISNDTTKIEYNGAHLSVFGNHMEVIAVDYQRIAIASEDFQETMPDEFLINIPKKTVMDVMKIFDGEKILRVETDKRQVSFKSDNICVTSRLIEKFIQGASRLFNAEYKLKATVNKSRLYEVVKRVSAITSEVTHGVNLSFNQTNLTVSSLETEYGKGMEVIEDVKFNGESIDIIFNSKHLLEILSNISGDNIDICMNTGVTPALLKPEEKSVSYLLVPIHIENIS